MRVLVDIVHPADALFFHHPIRRLHQTGDAVLIASRAQKDITTTLVDALGHHHQPVTTAGHSPGGLLLELGLRDVAILRMARKFRPDVMVGFGGIAIAHVGWLLGIPSLAFYDTEIAHLQIGVTLPFITEWHVPETYRGRMPRVGSHRFRAIAPQLSYFHPENFKPNLSRAIAAGLDVERDNFLVRSVAWSSNHDIGKRGWTSAELIELVTGLAAHGRVHVSAEESLPRALDGYRYQGDVLELHHLLAYCRAFVGQSATMATEAAVLGVPAIYTVNDSRGYLDELVNRGLVFRSASQFAKVWSTLEGILRLDKNHWVRCRNEALSECINVADYVTAAIERYRPQT